MQVEPANVRAENRDTVFYSSGLADKSTTVQEPGAERVLVGYGGIETCRKWRLGVAHTEYSEAQRMSVNHQSH